MSMHNVGSRTRPTLGIMSAVAGAGTTMWWAGGNPAGFGHGLTSADFDVLLARTVGMAAWFALGWLTLALVLEISAGLPGLAGRLAARASRYVTPRALRRLTQALLGASLLIGPVVAVPAEAAAPRSPSSSAAPSSAVSTTGDAASMSLDRPTSATATVSPKPIAGEISLDRPAPTAAVEAATAPGASPSRSATDLGRPNVATPYVAPAPKPPIKTEDPRPSTLLTGTAHRSTDDTGYVVQRGDALWDIAARHLGPAASAAEIARAWPRWYSANRAVIGVDPSTIHPGQILFAPAS